MTTNLSIDPANNGTLEGTFRHILGKMVEGIDTMLPAQVISYDRASNRATVQPLIKLVKTDNSSQSRAQVNNIPVLLIGGGGYLISFPLKPGDLGWILAADRDISLFTQNYQDAIPNTGRKKDFGDSLFIPDAMKGYSIDESDSDNLVIQSLNGDVKISLSSDTIKFEAENIILNGDAQIDGNLSVTGDLNIDGNGTIGGDLTVDGIINGSSGMNLTGNLAVVGNITATGDITPHV